MKSQRIFPQLSEDASEIFVQVPKVCFILFVYYIIWIMVWPVALEVCHTSEKLNCQHTTCITAPQLITETKESF